MFDVKLLGAAFSAGLAVGGLGTFIQRDGVLNSIIKEERATTEKLQAAEIRVRELEKDLESKKLSIVSDLAKRNRALAKKSSAVKERWTQKKPSVTCQNNEVSRESGLFLIDLMQKADQMRNQLQACQGWVRSLTATYNKETQP